VQMSMNLSPHSLLLLALILIVSRRKPDKFALFSRTAISVISALICSFDLGSHHAYHECCINEDYCLEFHFWDEFRFDLFVY